MAGSTLQLPSQPIKKKKKREDSSQWAAQFLVAGELARHKYIVSFTMGNNTPLADLMVGHLKTGAQFWVDVKGQWSCNAWWADSKPQCPNLFYILVRVGSTRSKDRFFIMDQAELDGLITQYQLAHSTAKPVGGFNWTDPHKYENQWSKLPSW